MRSGTANLPLHGGRVPSWLSTRMTALGRVITEAIVHEYGRDEFLRRIAHPFWFQSFGAVMGMDWHSSGITTSVMGALKRGLKPIEDELGIYVCGGRGKHSRKTPGELMTVGERTGLDGEALARISRLVAKIDSAAVQDGFQLYLHSFIVGADGKWTVVQQGMNGDRKEARRYHWLSSVVKSFVDDPHSAIDGPNQGDIINLADYRASKSRQTQVDLIAQGPDAILHALRHDVLPHLVMPAHHDVRAEDVIPRRLHGTLAAAAERGPKDFEELLLTPGVGARTVEALALVAEVIYGNASRFQDPARFSLAHGGKDGHPFPVPLDVFDRSIGVLRQAVETASLDNGDRLAALKRLHQESVRMEAFARGPSTAEYIVSQRASSASYGGRTVADDRPARIAPRPGPAKASQLAFGGAWQRSEPGPAQVAMSRSTPAIEVEEKQLRLFALHAPSKRAAG